MTLEWKDQINVSELIMDNVRRENEHYWGLSQKQNGIKIIVQGVPIFF